MQYHAVPCCSSSAPRCLATGCGPNLEIRGAQWASAGPGGARAAMLVLPAHAAAARGAARRPGGARLLRAARGE